MLKKKSMVVLSKEAGTCLTKVLLGKPAKHGCV